MNKRISFQYKIIAIMIVVILLVSLTGIFTYRRFTNIITKVTEESRVDMRLVTAKSLMNEVFEAENNVKTYSLTKDTTYLEKFYESTDRAYLKLERLHGYSSQKEMLVEDVDSLDTLVVKKFKGLNDYLILQDKFRVQMALDKVIENVEKKVLDEDKDSEEKGILYKLFNRNKEKDEEQKKRNEKITVGVISEEIKNIKATEKIIEANLKQKELALLTTDTKINKQINALINKLEAREMAAISKQTKKAEQTMHKTNWQIAIFCVLTALLLVLMAYLIINYIRNNRQYRQALKQARAKAEDLAKTKERFLANMSHELRTPMNAIAGFTEQLSKSTLNKEQSEQLSMVRKSIDHLLYLINDVLDFTKLQAGKLKLENIEFRPKAFIEDVVTFVKPLAEEKKTKINCNIKTSDDLILRGDPFRLRQILLNLISNSLKFTEKGIVTITLSQLMKHDSHTIIRLEIQDTGIGMTEEQLARVFQEFEQAEENTSRNYGGTGLGLSIVHMLAELHDGKVDITSAPNKGTTVTVEIPYEIGTEEGISQFEQNEEEKNVKLNIPKNLKILIVDDEKYNRKLLTTILKSHQAILTESSNGLEAVKEIKSNNYDLVLMDAYMPELDGISASKKIRKMSDKSKNSVPIIALTAAVTEEDRENYTNAGMNGFVAKPFKENELLGEINRILSVSNESISIIKKKIKHQKSKVPQQKHIDFSGLSELSDGDDKFYTEMLNTFLDSTSEGIKDIEKALKENNWKMLAEYSHKICAPAKHLSAEVLYSHLKEIELKSRNKDALNSIENNVAEVKKEFKFIKAEIEAELNK
ncbi:MAG: ATP-binding protein [Brumimicrobium sp.]